MGDDALGPSATPPMRPAGAVLLSSSDLPGWGRRGEAGVRIFPIDRVGEMRIEDLIALLVGRRRGCGARGEGLDETMRASEGGRSHRAGCLSTSGRRCVRAVRSEPSVDLDFIVARGRGVREPKIERGEFIVTDSSFRATNLTWTSYRVDHEIRIHVEVGSKLTVNPFRSGQKREPPKKWTSRAPTLPSRQRFVSTLGRTGATHGRDKPR